MHIQRLLLIPFSLALSCTSSAPPTSEAGTAKNPLTQGTGEILAQVGNTPIRASQLLGRVNEQSALLKQHHRQDKRMLLRQLELMIEEQLLLQAHYDKHKERYRIPLR
ncbi:MAG: hypothetical protein JRH20_22060, partial [Deltaproteobacteria bacterium]|nr:hypothetical protein [Deltaproteobacteria bacterium]